MNLINLDIPFTTFYLWRTSSLKLPLLRSMRRLAIRGDMQLMVEAPTFRCNRIEMRTPSTGRSGKEDIGFHYVLGSASPRYDGHSYYPAFIGQNALSIGEWRITVAGQRNDTIMWYESTMTGRTIIPRHIILTDRGWQTVEYFKANPHLKMYRPRGRNNKIVLQSNYREIDRDTMVYDDTFGYYDTTNYARVEVEGRQELHSIDDTFTHRGDTYPISAGAYRINDLVKMRKFVRRLVARVLADELTLPDAIEAFNHAIRHDGWAEILPRRNIPTITPDVMWRGLYTKNFVQLQVEKVRILRELAETTSIINSPSMSIASCSSCNAMIYTWQPHETAVIDVAEFNNHDDANEHEAYQGGDQMTFHYCSEEHAMRHNAITDQNGLPNKYGYHTDVLGRMSMGNSKCRAPNGELRRCGIELETYHTETTSGMIKPYIVGGTIHTKAKQKKTKKAVSWSDSTYRTFGAIPTRDGSLHETFGVEWVFRPSDLKGLESDLGRFLATTNGFIEHDAGEADGTSRTYGLHVHVTATDTMQQRITRTRVALVASRLDVLFHTIGKRGYTNYTRALDARFILNTEVTRQSRASFINYINRGLNSEYENLYKPWMKYAAPRVGGSSSHRHDQFHINNRHSKVHIYPRNADANDMYRDALNSNLFVRYNMTNISTGRPTIEFRHARSYVDSSYIMLNTELAQATALFASYEVMSVQQVSYDQTPYQFRDYVLQNRKDYPRLAEWFLQNLGQDLVTPRASRVLQRIGG